MPERITYRWRRMIAEQRRAVLQSRQSHRLPWHTPPHYSSEAGVYMLTAACYEHRPVIGQSAERMAQFERDLLDLSGKLGERLFAWTVLFYASLVYVLHNAVKHGYVTRWQDWPYCNARPFLEQVGRDEAARMWREFPIAEFGADWDPAEL